MTTYSEPHTYRDHQIIITRPEPATYGFIVTSDTFTFTASFASTNPVKAFRKAQAVVDERITELETRRMNRPTIYAR